MTRDEMAKAGQVYVEDLPTDSRADFDKGLTKLRRSSRRAECIDAYQDDLLWERCRGRKAGRHLKLARKDAPLEGDELAQARIVRDVRNAIRGRTPAEIRIFAKDRYTGLMKVAGWIETHDGKKTLGEESTISDDIILGLLGLDIKRDVA